jgi:putative nucleotidyltransferase with HDIG domain
MITAEPIADLKNNVLLEANAEITEPHAAILKTWNIDFIRVREKSDTDDSLKKQLAEDLAKEKGKMSSEQIKNELGIFESNIKSILGGDGDKHLYSKDRESKIGGGAIKITSLLSSKTLDGYLGMLQELDKLFTSDSRGRDLFLRDACSSFVAKLNRFVIGTPGIIGYCLYPYRINVSVLTEHSIRTTIIAAKLAQLAGLDSREIMVVTYGAILHDIGCTELPDNMRNFSKRFSLDEQKLYKKHVLTGVNIIKSHRFLPREVLLIIGSHHEMMDGSGYPLSLSAEKLPGVVRAVALANAIDRALYPLNSGKEAIKLPQLIKELPHWTLQFDPKMCAILIKYFEDFIMSNRVTLDDGRLAEIVWSHAAYKEPVVRTSDGEIVDLNKIVGLNIESYSI